MAKNTKGKRMGSAHSGISEKKVSKAKPVTLPLKDRYRAVISNNGQAWSLQWFNDRHRWTKLASGVITDDDPQLKSLRSHLVVPTPDEALKVSLGVQRARASLP